MIKRSLLILLPISYLVSGTSAYADYMDLPNAVSTKSYDFSSISIPNTVGTSSVDVSGNAFFIDSRYSDSTTATIELTINGTLLGDGKTYATDKPGVGIQYTLHMANDAGLSPSGDITVPPYRYTFTGHASTPGIVSGNTVNIWYRLVRVQDYVPTGDITSVPDAIITLKNPPGEGDDSIFTSTVLSDIAAQPKIIPCTINAPTEIKLPPLYGANLVNGAQNITDVPAITLTKCPGAINNITYNFAAVYGTYKASDGVLNTVEGDGYAKGVYVQIQNADGSAHKINGAINLDGYNGAGDYDIPGFKVAYYINDVNAITVGNVKTAINLTLSYS